METHDSANTDHLPLAGRSTISRREISGGGSFLCYPTQLIRLRHLRFGHECLHGEVNLRHPTRADGEQLAPSILREGLLQALSVWPSDSESADGPYYVIAGGRRLAALHVLRETGLVTDDLPVSCVIVPGDSAAEALARSMVTEDTHVQPHPVDRFDAFHRLAERGFDAAQIATRFFVDKKIVRQALALGDLAGEVRDAWRAGEIDEPAAQCFTLAASKEQQVKVLAKLRKKGGTIDAATVRKQFTGSEAEANRLLKFVGRNEYVAAGGALTEDLFTTSIIVHNFAKLKSLAEAKLEAEATRLKSEGWSFTEIELTRNFGWHGRETSSPMFTSDEVRRRAAITKRQREIQDAAEQSDGDIAEMEELMEEAAAIHRAGQLRSYTPEQKAKLGVLLRPDDNGTAIITEPGLKPKPEPTSTSPSRGGRQNAEHFSGGGKSTEQAPPITAETEHAVLQWRALASGETLARDETLSLGVLLAHMQTSAGPIGLIPSHHVAHVFVPKTDSFGHALAALRKQSGKTLLALLVKAIGDEVDLDSDFDHEDFLDALDQVEFAKALKRRFDAKVYFNGCSKPHLLNIINEVLGEDLSAYSKHDLADECVKRVAPTGWLPPELRTAAYVIPGERQRGKGTHPPRVNAAKKSKPQSKPKTPTAAAKRALAKAQRP